jgi:hypothetical protein
LHRAGPFGENAGVSEDIAGEAPFPAAGVAESAAFFSNFHAEGT